MTEMFRFEVIEAMFKKGVLTPDVANNLVSWRHSGFHVHASSPFMPADGDLLRTRLAYAFRPPVALGRMGFDGTTVTVRTQKKQLLQLSPTDFLAKLTTHIPDRYQNIRRYAGFYASVVQARVRRAATNTKGQANACSPRIESKKPIRPKWALLIAKIFGSLPIACPKCNTVMELKACITDPAAIAKAFPNSARRHHKLHSTATSHHSLASSMVSGWMGFQLSQRSKRQTTMPISTKLRPIMTRFLIKIARGKVAVHFFDGLPVCYRTISTPMARVPSQKYQQNPQQSQFQTKIQRKRQLTFAS